MERISTIFLGKLAEPRVHRYLIEAENPPLESFLRISLDFEVELWHEGPNNATLLSQDQYWTRY